MEIEAIVVTTPIMQTELAQKSKSAPAIFLALLAMRRPDKSVWSNRDELAARTGLNGSTVSSGISALLEANWIRRNPDSWNHGFFINPLILKRLGLETGRSEL